MDINTLSSEIQNGDSTALARGITLIESSRSEDWPKIKTLLQSLKGSSKKSRRLGFSGPPGVGKSSFIEKLGIELIRKSGGRVAVLAVDPSSEITGGSIMGDKTRMEELSRNDNAFVRPSPSRGHLGGVTSSLAGVLELCEAAGYDWILVESVGVGQSEIELSRMVDLFTLISQPGAGDELQGIKKGILEYVDVIAVNKADRDKGLVNATIQQFLAALKIVRSQQILVKPCSALTGEGVPALAQHYMNHFQNFDFSKRPQFNLFWFDSLLQSEFRKRIASDEAFIEVIERLKKEIEKGQTLPVEAVDQFFKKLGLSS